MKQNPYNGVVCLGHGNGTVTMWTPNMNTPVVRMFCHDAPVQALTVDRTGWYFATTGLDGKMKVWDIRKYQKLHSYYTTKPGASLDISQKGLLAVASGSEVLVWKDALRTKAQSPYMRHSLQGKHVGSVMFRPYEDLLGVGHAQGICSMVVPGSGEPNYDAFEANPYQTTKQRRETGVHKLLDQLPPDTIMLNPDELGTVDRTPQEMLMRERKLAEQANQKSKVVKKKNRARGRNKIGTKLKKGQQNVMTLEKQKLREKLDKQRQARLQAQSIARQKKKLTSDNDDSLEEINVLSRFKKRRISNNRP
jgi:U3 small nucleolar RNA-associated protein 7